MSDETGSLMPVAKLPFARWQIGQRERAIRLRHSNIRIRMNKKEHKKGPFRPFPFPLSAFSLVSKLRPGLCCAGKTAMWCGDRQSGFILLQSYCRVMSGGFSLRRMISPEPDRPEADQSGRWPQDSCSNTADCAAHIASRSDELASCNQI